MTSPSSDPFGERLRRWRRVAEIKQVRLAELLGVSQGTVSRWEQGLQRPAPLQQRLLSQLMTRQRAGGLDAAVKRLVCNSRRRVHLIEDRSHRLLCASAPRLREWRRGPADLLGRSLWRYATPEIARAERDLHAIGWHEGGIEQWVFATSGREGEPLRILDRFVRWERFHLSDGTAVRLTTGYDGPPAD